MPNTYDQNDLGQAQHQDITTFNVAPGYSRVFGSRTLFTANGFVRRDHLTYSPSPNPFADLPATVSQDRTLTNFGVKADLAYDAGAHNMKLGGAVSATKLHEGFTFGITDPTDPAFADENGTFNPALAPYDLTQPGGAPLAYDQSFTVKQQSAYVQDDIKAARRDIQARRAGRPLRRADDRDARSAASRRVVRRAGERDGAARLVRPHARDALQREPPPVGRVRLEWAVWHQQPRLRRASGTSSR